MVVFLRPQQILVTTAVLAVSLYFALHAPTRIWLRSALLNYDRRIVSTAVADLSKDGSLYKILKVAHGDKLQVEVYSIDRVTGETLKSYEPMVLSSARDGYFNFNGEAANLAVDDIDGSGRLSILAPVFDRDLNGHLEIFQLSGDKQSVYRVQN